MPTQTTPKAPGGTTKPPAANKPPQKTKATHPKHPALAIGSAACQCGGCGLGFNSDAAFQKHRVFADAKAQNWDTRHCLTPTEMLAIGMALNARDLWITKAYDGPRTSPHAQEA